MTEHRYSEPPIEHTNANFPPPAFPSVPPEGLLNEPPEPDRSEDRAFDLTARAFFQGALAQSPWLKQYIELVQFAEGERATGFALGQVAQLGGQCAHEYQVRSAHDMGTIEGTERIRHENQKPKPGTTEVLAAFESMLQKYLFAGTVPNVSDA
jgi:hypothetical protein